MEIFCPKFVWSEISNVWNVWNKTFRCLAYNFFCKLCIFDIRHWYLYLAEWCCIKGWIKEPHPGDSESFAGSCCSSSRRWTVYQRALQAGEGCCRGAFRWWGWRVWMAWKLWLKSSGKNRAGTTFGMSVFSIITACMLIELYFKGSKIIKPDLI